MKTKEQNEKIITALVAGVVLIMAVFGSEFRSYGESANTKIEVSKAPEATLSWDDLREEEVFELAEPVVKTAKLYNQKGELVEMAILLEEESMDEVYTGPHFNKAKFLATYGDVSVYQMID